MWLNPGQPPFNMCHLFFSLFPFLSFLTKKGKVRKEKEVRGSSPSAHFPSWPAPIILFLPHVLKMSTPPHGWRQSSHLPNSTLQDPPVPSQTLPFLPATVHRRLHLPIPSPSPSIRHFSFCLNLLTERRRHGRHLAPSLAVAPVVAAPS